MVGWSMFLAAARVLAPRELRQLVQSPGLAAAGENPATAKAPAVIVTPASRRRGGGGRECHGELLTSVRACRR